jgi:hypothetical protein
MLLLYNLYVLCMLYFTFVGICFPVSVATTKIDFYASILSLVAIFVGVGVVAHVAVLLC